MGKLLDSILNLLIEKLPYGLFIVKQRLIQFSLLLENGCKIAVGGSKLGENLECLQVEAGGLLDVPLLPLDVGEVVQAVGVGG